MVTKCLAFYAVHHLHRRIPMPALLAARLNRVGAGRAAPLAGNRLILSTPKAKSVMTSGTFRGDSPKRKPNTPSGKGVEVSASIVNSTSALFGDQIVIQDFGCDRGRGRSCGGGSTGGSREALRKGFIPFLEDVAPWAAKGKPRAAEREGFFQAGGSTLRPPAHSASPRRCKEQLPPRGFG